MMNEELIWASLILVALLLILAAWFLRSFLQLRGRVRTREMLHKERMAALSKNLTPIIPEHDEAEWRSSASMRLVETPALKAVSFVGTALLSGGAGLGLGFLLSGYGVLEKLSSVSLLPIMLGLGLIIYSLLLEKITKSAKAIQKLT